MQSHQTFVNRILAKPHRLEPAQAYGRWLTRQGDPRAEAWNAYCAVRQAAAQDGPAPRRRRRSTVRPHVRGSARQQVLQQQFACLCLRFTPLGDGRRCGELLPGRKALRLLALAELHAAGLVDAAAIPGQGRTRRTVFHRPATPEAFFAQATRLTARIARMVPLAGAGQCMDNFLPSVLEMTRLLAQFVGSTQQLEQGDRARAGAQAWQNSYQQCLWPPVRGRTAPTDNTPAPA